MVRCVHAREHPIPLAVHVVAGIILVLHGMVQPLGVAAYLRLVKPEGLAYPSSLLGGLLPAPAALVQWLGVRWFVAAGGFVVDGLALILRSWWWPVVLAAALLSLVLSAPGWPEFVLSAAILVGLLLPAGSAGTSRSRL
jgi:hypothetical protein